MIRIVAALALLVAVEPAVAGSPHLRMCNPGERNTSTKTCVVDGDTLWLRGVDYRLRDYDTPEPETAICGGSAEVALAHKASARFLSC